MTNDETPKSAGHPFTGEEISLLSRLAKFIIPPSDEYGLPGADDGAIIATFLTKGARSADLLKEGLAAFSRLAEQRGQDLGRLDDDGLDPLWVEFEKTRPAFTQSVMTLTAQSYYQDPRVLASLGIETDPPFPAGRQVPQGDWSLLDGVKQRDSLYRDV